MATKQKDHSISKDNSDPLFKAGKQTDPLSGKVTGRWEGFPFRGTPPNIKKDDPDYLLPQPDYEVKVKVFRTYVKEDMVEYEKVLHDVAKGLAIVSKELQEYNKDKEGWDIFLRWIYPFFRNIRPDEMELTRKETTL